MAKKKGKKSSERSINISKGIILLFFTGYLIFYGIGISFFVEQMQINNPGTLPVYVSYVPLACFVGAAFCGMRFLIFLKTINTEKARQTKSRKKVKAGTIYKQALFLLIFIFSFIPLMSPIIDQGKNDQNMSVYNEGWNGATEFKAIMEDEGFEVMNVQSSLSATQRLNKSICLVLLGPNTFYNPTNEVPYFIDFFAGDDQDGDGKVDSDRKNAILICHDHGSTDTLLWEIFLANMFDPNVRDKVPITLFPEGILRDNASYDTRPDFPVINTFVSHPTTQGIKNVILSQATCVLGGPFVQFSGWNVVGYSSIYSYVDKNDDHKYNFDDDSIDISFVSNAIGEDFPDDVLKIPLGGYPQAVFMAKETDNARVFVSSDASLFNNELITEGKYDNAEFGKNIIEWLTYAQDKDDWVIVFDEAHIRPEYSRDLTSPGIFGFIIQYVVNLSTNPITAWIYPLLAIYTLRRYLPKKDQKEEEKKAKEVEKKEEREKFRTSSFFSEKIQWYHDKSHYEGALKLLYRRLERKLNAQLGGRPITTQNVIDLVIGKEGKVSRMKERRIVKFMDRIIAIKEGKGKARKVRDPKDFEELFFEMEWMMLNI
ncbi:MAG: hypothetical protein EU533_08195 [Promethearchaeota archaeon]|nr:MAG: hypothetical protein EU533_08195 [Candidatus Lokiarchaeota archaeon]